MKVLITDFDGTLCLTHSNLIDVRANVTALKLFKNQKDIYGNNNIIIIATAREPNSIKKYVDMYNIPCDYIISYIGALIWDCINNKFIYYNYFPAKVTQKIFDYLEPYKTKFQLEIVSNVLNPTENQHIGYVLHNKNNNDLFTKMSNDFGCSLEDIFNNKMNNGLFFTRLLSNELFFINNIQNSKLKAIDILLNDLTLDGKIDKMTEIYTIGDGLDDFEMLKKYNGYRITISEEALSSRYSQKVDSVKKYIEMIL